MIGNSMKRGTCTHMAKALALTVVFCIAVSHGQTSSDSSAPATTRKAAVSDLQASCRPDAVQAVAAKLSIGVTVKEIPDGPKLPGGTKYVAASKDVPAYCQVTGAFVTNPKTGKTVDVPPKKLPFFKVGKELKGRVNAIEGKVD